MLSYVTFLVGRASDNGSSVYEKQFHYFEEMLEFLDKQEYAVLINGRYIEIQDFGNKK